MQNQIIGNDSEFCDCETVFKTVLLLPNEDGSERTIDGEPYEQPPERCETCNKLNAAPFEFTFTIKPNVTINE